MNNRIKSVLDSYEDRTCSRFKPTDKFYKTVGINQKRFGQLLRNEKPIYAFEALSLAKFFSVPLEEIL